MTLAFLALLGALYVYEISSLRVKGNCLTLKMEAVQSLEMPGATHQWQCHISKHLNLQQHCYVNLKFHSHYRGCMPPTIDRSVGSACSMQFSCLPNCAVSHTTRCSLWERQMLYCNKAIKLMFQWMIFLTPQVVTPWLAKAASRLWHMMRRDLHHHQQP